jgi:hypothetical protein
MRQQNLLESLSNVRWHIAHRTYGNNHATLIGLLVDWWITRAPTQNWALESGPSFNLPGSGMAGSGMCDAVLGTAQHALGILEVEGMRPTYTAEKIGRYFAALDANFGNLQFGILVLYSTGARGRGKEKTFQIRELQEAQDAATEVSRHHSLRDLFVLVVKKKLASELCGLRARSSQYYSGFISEVQGIHLRAGVQWDRRILFSEAPSSIQDNPSNERQGESSTRCSSDGTRGKPSRPTIC